MGQPPPYQARPAPIRPLPRIGGLRRWHAAIRSPPRIGGLRRWHAANMAVRGGPAGDWPPEHHQYAALPAARRTPHRNRATSGCRLRIESPARQSWIDGGNRILTRPGQGEVFVNLARTQTSSSPGVTRRSTVPRLRRQIVASHSSVFSMRSPTVPWIAGSRPAMTIERMGHMECSTEMVHSLTGQPCATAGCRKRNGRPRLCGSARSHNRRLALPPTR